MSAAIPLRPVALPTPLFTRHMVGATESERDRRLQGRVRGVVRYTSPLAPPEAVLLKAA
jgi:hypothetical protein